MAISLGILTYILFQTHPYPFWEMSGKFDTYIIFRNNWRMFRYCWIGVYRVPTHLKDLESVSFYACDDEVNEIQWGPLILTRFFTSGTSGIRNLHGSTFPYKQYASGTGRHEYTQRCARISREQIYNTISQDFKGANLYITVAIDNIYIWYTYIYIYIYHISYIYIYHIYHIYHISYIYNIWYKCCNDMLQRWGYHLHIWGIILLSTTGIHCSMMANRQWWKMVI